MSRAKPKIVLYQSRAKDPASGSFPSFDQLPLEMLHVGALPDREGYDVVIIDANLYPPEVAHQRAVEETADAMIFGTTAILGYMVWDGHLAATRVRAARPGISIIAGGWFPSCNADLYLRSGIYDAVCIGQGELTFLDFVHAVEAGEPADRVPGLALWRDGQVVRTVRRAIVGWDKVPRAAWHLIDIEPYRERQLRRGAHAAQNRFPAPPAKRSKGEHNYFGISYFSSYGCPEPCAFCCSPELTERRWTAMPAGEMLDDLEELQSRWGFETVRFQDANWGVNARRSRDFAQGLLDRDLKFGWTTTLEPISILRYGPELLDLLRDSGLYLACVGAETATTDMMTIVGKPNPPSSNPAVVQLLDERGIIASVTYIIGFPYEKGESMLATLDQARAIQVACPTASVEVYPFRPIPGNPMYRQAIDLGYRPPSNLQEWGHMLDYHTMNVWKGHIPDAVERTRRLYYQYASYARGSVRDKDGLIERIARWRIRSGEYRLPLDLKAFYALDQLVGWSARKRDEKQRWMMTSEDGNSAVVGASDGAVRR